MTKTTAILLRIGWVARFDLERRTGGDRRKESDPLYAGPEQRVSERRNAMLPQPVKEVGQ